MSPSRLLVLTTLAMLAFAGNSLLCRAALRHTSIDAGSFTVVRLVSGAVVLWLLVRMRPGQHQGRGNWWSALALFAYAAGFSYAYVSLSTGTGALLLFGAVQITMIGYGVWRGERLRQVQLLGMLLAFGGLVTLLLPGLSAPPLPAAALMLGAGAAWAVYSLRGKGAGDPIRVTTGNFGRASVLALVLGLLVMQHIRLDWAGVGYALASGMLASAVGYAIWYTALPALKATHAATVQLSVPVIAALGGIVMLGEPLSWRLSLASLAILGGIALVMREKRSEAAESRATDK